MKKQILRVVSLVLLCAFTAASFCSCFEFYTVSNRMGPAMWVVEDADGNRIYLLGSIHIGTEDMFPLCDEIMDAFSSCDYLAVEYDILAAEKALENATAEETAAYAAQFLYTDGTTIKDHLSADTYGKAVAYLKEKGCYSNTTDYFVAPYWESVITQLMTADTGYSSDYGVDRYLINSAYEKGITVLDVESEQYQIGVLMSAADEVSEVSLKSVLTLGSSDALKNQYRTILLYYNRGDMSVMSKFLSSEVDESEYDEATVNALKEYNSVMYDERNANMTKTVVQYMEDGKSVFFVVGLAHMLGDNGIVSALTSAGYLVYRK